MPQLARDIVKTIEAGERLLGLAEELAAEKGDVDIAFRAQE